jgi:MarR family transcriptional regulator, organic hydroperoxide resistance regulator
MSKHHYHRPLEAEVIIQLRTFGSGAILFNQRVAERVGLHLTDMQCMNLLDVLGPSTPGLLAEGMCMTTGGVTVLLDRLEKAGCVRREPNPEDRRSLLVRANPRKMEMINAEFAELAEQFHAYLAKMPEADMSTVVEFFKQVNALRMNAALREGKPCKRAAGL